MLFYSFFKSLVGKDVVVELKNDLSICGTLHSVDQYLNIKLTDISVTDPEKYPHMEAIIMDKSFGMEGIMQHPQNASETSMNEDQIEGNFSDSPVFNSSICDLSDEEISTKKDKHMRLGPEDLNDTIPYNY